MMSIRKTKSNDISYSYRQEIFRSLKKRKIETIGIIITLLLVGFDFLAYTRSLYSIFMLSGITIYVIYYFLQSVILYTRLRLSLKVLEENPDFKAFKETLEKLTPEKLKQFQDIQEAEAKKAKSEGHNVKDITEE